HWTRMAEVELEKIAPETPPDTGSGSVLDLHVNQELTPTGALRNLDQEIGLPALPLGQVEKQLLIEECRLRREAGGESCVHQQEQLPEEGPKQILEELVVARHRKSP